MDALLLMAAAGTLAGLVASVVPGLHVNALAAATLAWWPALGAPGVAFLVCAFAASPFGAALSATFLGGTSEEDALGSLPAQALAREGRAVEAAALQCWGALLGVLLALPLALAARALLAPAEPWLADAMPWLLLIIIVLLVATEPARLPVHRVHVLVPWTHGTVAPRGRIEDPHGLLHARPLSELRAEPRWVEGPHSRAAGKAAALLCLALAGLLGLAAFRLGATSPLGWPASPLLPLLAGLFAVPSLVGGLRARRRPRGTLRPPRYPSRELLGAAAPGAAVSSLLGLAPGVSASHAGLLAPRADAPERALVRLAAIHGGAVVFTLAAWHALGKARSGALVAAQAYAPPLRWTTWAPAPELLREAALVLAAALAAALLARAASARLARLVREPRAWTAGGLVLLVAAVALFNGPLGLLELSVSACVGALPALVGVRRSHAMGVILVPALLRAWGLS